MAGTSGAGRKTKVLIAWAALALAVFGATALRLPANAPANIEPLLGVNVSRGFIDVAMIGPKDSIVTFSEEIDGVRQEIGTAGIVVKEPTDTDGLASIPAIPWNCIRNVRRFIASAKTPDGKVIELVKEARTPDCRDRLALTAPSRVEKGEKLPITIKDRWQIGDLTLRLCIARTGAARTCSRLNFKPGDKTLSFSRNAGKKVALLDLDMIVAGTHRHLKVGVGRAAPAVPRPVALVTGDSMMQGIDTILAEKLKTKYRVIGQTRPGTGVSKKLDTPWTTFARQQVTKHKPTVTIVLLGGNEGYPMTTAAGNEVKCCGEPWRMEYLERLKQMATAYLRDGRGTLVWSLLPPPRRADLKEQMDAVNDAIRRLAAALPSVHLVGLDKLFGPSYKDEIGGRQVRDPDGLHFNLAGQRMAAQAIIEALRAATALVPIPPATPVK